VIFTGETFTGEIFTEFAERFYSAIINKEIKYDD
jgi:hypothetical protein